MSYPRTFGVRGTGIVPAAAAGDAAANKFLKADGSFASVAGSGGWNQGCKLYSATDQNLLTGVATAISFSSAIYDTDTMYSAGSPTRITIKTAGKYAFGGASEIEANAGGTYRQLYIQLNGDSTKIRGLDLRFPNAGVINWLLANGVDDFSVNDYIEMIMGQDSGVTLKSKSEANQYTQRFWAYRIG